MRKKGRPINKRSKGKKKLLEKEPGLNETMKSVSSYFQGFKVFGVGRGGTRSDRGGVSRGGTGSGRGSLEIRFAGKSKDSSYPKTDGSFKLGRSHFKRIKHRKKDLNSKK